MKKIVAMLLAVLMVCSIGAALADTFNVGDYVYFGHYEQDNNLNDGDERIRWLVIKTEGNKLFLLSEKGLEKHQWNERSDGSMWADSAIRRWLNSDFLYTAFTYSEQQSIFTTTVEDTLAHSNRNWNSGLRYGDITYDKVFLLSYKEMNELVSPRDRYCEPSQYVIKKRIAMGSHAGKKTCWYWLRTSAFRNNAGVISETNGGFETCYIHHTFGVVRPAIWVDASAVSRY
ncbi:MAG: hypothetical protein IKS31_02270 [Clostridia bacterium]|nr:hypothetical protein [Clostridia bacterium]